MHRSKIEWVDDTWNPVTGCLNECEYCYARKKVRRFSGDIRLNKSASCYKGEKSLQILETPFISETGGTLNYPFGFEPTYHRYRLNYPEQRKNGCSILVGEVGEMFGDWVPDAVLKEIFESCHKRKIHKYIFLTKYPKRYGELLEAGILPTDSNFWYGTTITKNEDYIPQYIGINNFLNIEPCLEKIELPEDGKIANWIIIGAETGSRRQKIEPQKEWIEEVAKYADRIGIPIFMKSSLLGIMGEQNLRQEFPQEFLTKDISPLLKVRRESDCAMCKSHGKKNEMIALSARSRRGEMPKQLCYLCKNCFYNFCKINEIQVPDLEGLKNEKEELPQDKSRDKNS